MKALADREMAQSTLEVAQHVEVAPAGRVGRPVCGDVTIWGGVETEGSLPVLAGNRV
jgi:hypothetical protein